jgi:hypothetical protein
MTPCAVLCLNLRITRRYPQIQRSRRCPLSHNPVPVPKNFKIPEAHGRADRYTLGRMNAGAEIDALVKRFVAGQPFGDFWQAFMDFYEAFDDSVLPPEQRVRFEHLYEWVYMGQADPTSDAERELGLVGESELRERLRDFRVASAESSPGTQLP